MKINLNCPCFKGQINLTITKTENLEAKFDSRASFYGKAKVLSTDNGTKILKSYESIVAIYDGEMWLASDVSKIFTQTTLRHIKEFFSQFVNEDIYIDKKQLSLLKETYSFTTERGSF